MPPNKSPIPDRHFSFQGNVCKGNGLDTAAIYQNKPVTDTSMGDAPYKKGVPREPQDERDNGSSGTQRIGGSQGSDRPQGSGGDGEENPSGASGRGACSTGMTCREGDLKKEQQRLKTFVNWPHTFLTPKDLTAAGFYHVRDDLVRCAFCKIEIVKWEEGDIPLKEHKRWSANCPFVRGIACGNVPLDGDNSSSQQCHRERYSEDRYLSYDTCGIYEEVRPFSFCDDESPNSVAQRSMPQVVRAKNGPSEGEDKEQTLERLGVRDMHVAVHQEYCSEAARLASFSSWPVAMKQRPKDLADAGFYYTGNGDQTICFHCGGGLRDWEEGDDPWIEHAKWFSKCHFLHLVKGSDFVSAIAETRPALLNAEDAKNLVQSCVSPNSQEVASAKAVQATSEERETTTGSSASTSNDKAAIPGEGSTKGLKDIKDEARLCKICYASELGVVLLPCGHMVACVKCAPSLTVCPVCRQPFTHTVRAYIP